MKLKETPLLKSVRSIAEHLGVVGPPFASLGFPPTVDFFRLGMSEIVTTHAKKSQTFSHMSGTVV